MLVGSCCSLIKAHVPNLPYSSILKGLKYTFRLEKRQNQLAFWIGRATEPVIIDDFVLVSEGELKKAIITLLDTTHQQAEGVGAASTAAALKMRDRFKDKKVVLPLTGGNLPLKKFRAILEEDRV